MAAGDKPKLPWGMSEKELKPNSVQSLPKSTLEAFSIGMTNPGLKKNVFQKSREEKVKKKKREEEETAKVLEEFVNTFEETSKSKMTFVRGAVINPDKNTDAVAGTIYQPSGSKAAAAIKKEQPKPSVVPPPAKPPAITAAKKKEKEKKRSVLEMFGDELKRIQEERKERKSHKRSGEDTSATAVDEDEGNELMNIDEQFTAGMAKGSGEGSTNLYIGNINPKMNEEMLCQHFGKFGALASVKIMWPRTEEERSRNRNCGFVAFMRRKDAEKALDAMKGSTILGHEVEIGWGKIVPLPPTPFYVAPDHNEERNTIMPDPPSGFPFNARPINRRSRSSGRGGGSYNNMPPPDSGDRDGGGGREELLYSDDPSMQSFEERLYNSIIKVVIPTDREVLRLIHRMIEFVIREGPMFEAMIMNKEMGNHKFRFLFDNQSPEHVYYRWKLFSILQGDSPETWKTEEFRMFEEGSLWRPPPLKNLRGKVLPPIMEIVKKGQLPHKNRNYLEDMLRSVTMERPKIRDAMIWCMEHAESSEEIVDCITESLTLMETPLTLKVARLYLLTDILQNCNAHVSCAARYRRGFEGKLLPIMEHFHDVMRKIESRIRQESFKRRVLRCLQSWDQLAVYHFNYVDKLREQFIGKTQEEIEKKKAFDTVAALMSLRSDDSSSTSATSTLAPPPAHLPAPTAMGVVEDYKPIDFSGGQSTFDIDDDIDGDPLPDPDVDGVPMEEDPDIDGVPMDENEMGPSSVIKPTAAASSSGSGGAIVQSKWELVDYEHDSSSSAAEEDNERKVVTDSKSSKVTVPELTQSVTAATASSSASSQEDKRQQLREVEIKVIELMTALESSGTYSSQEIQDRTTKFREKLIREVDEGVYALSSPDSSAKTSGKKKDKGDSDHKMAVSKDSYKSRRHSSRDQSTPPPPSSSSKDRSRSPHTRRKHRSRSKEKHKRHKSPSRTKSRSRSPRGKRKSKSPHRSRSPVHRASSRKERHRSRSTSPHKSKKSSRK